MTNKLSKSDQPAGTTSYTPFSGVGEGEATGAGGFFRYNPAMIRLCSLMALAAALLASPAHADPARLQRLYGLLIENEGGFAYIKHCEDMNLMLVENPYYTANARAVAVALTKEIVAEKPEYDMAAATEMVIQKQDALTESYEARYKRERCSGPTARKGKRHFDLFKSMPPLAFKGYLEKY